MNRLSIVYDSGFLWTLHNASGIHIVEVLNQLSKNHDVLLFGPDKKDCHIINHKFKVTYVSIISQSLLRYFIYETLLFFHLFFCVIKKSPDVIYARSKIGIASLVISLLFNIPRLVEVNGLTLEESDLRKESPMKIFVMTKIFEKLNYHISDRIIAVTDNIKQELIYLYGLPNKKIVVIPNGANTDLFKPMDTEECKTHLRLDRESDYICFVGNLAPWQGIEYLIDAAPQVIAKKPSSKFLIVGDGILKADLCNRAQQTDVADKIIFTGSVPYEEVPLYINASEACVVYKSRLGSGYSPLKLYEYMSCRNPVIASRIAGLEIVETANAGLLVEPENPDALATAIICALDNKNLRTTSGNNGRAYVIKNHSWALVAKRIEKSMAQVLEKKI